MRTYEDFASEAAYEMEDTHPPASNFPTRRVQNHPTHPIRHKRTELPNPSQEATSTGTTSMDVDQDLSEGTTPPGTPFEDDHTAHQQGGASFIDPPARVHTRNLFTPLYMETQETDHTTAITGHQPPQPPKERLATINEAEEEDLAAAAAAQAEAHRTAELEAEATALAAEAEALAAAATDEAEVHRAT